jgi:K+-transporting ATPase ATPase C chain
MMKVQFKSAALMTLLLCVLTGVAYPALVTGIAQLLFNKQANGSLVEVDGRVVGSALIGQPFSGAAYFHPRPSAAGSGYDAAASSGTNKGPTDRKLADTLIAARIDSLRSALGTSAPLPPDMVTASGSGLDPHISPANAHLQAAGVARARGVDNAAVTALVAKYTEGRQFGFLGEPRVNVLLLNIALDSAFGRSGAQQRGNLNQPDAIR